MDTTRRKGEHVEGEVVRPLLAFNAGTRPKLKSTV